MELVLIGFIMLAFLVNAVPMEKTIGNVNVNISTIGYFGIIIGSCVFYIGNYNGPVLMSIVLAASMILLDICLLNALDSRSMANEVVTACIMKVINMFTYIFHNEISTFSIWVTVPLIVMGLVSLIKTIYMMSFQENKKKRGILITRIYLAIGILMEAIGLGICCL